MSNTSVAAVLAERMAERLRLYREYVERAARGDELGHTEQDDVARTLRALGLPSFAWRRDVRAWSRSGDARGHRRAELAVLHPHLFDDPDAWVRARIGNARQAARFKV